MKALSAKISSWLWPFFVGCTLLPQTAFAEDLKRLPEDPFAAHYVHFELSRNFPVNKSQESFDPGPYHPAFTYLHNLNGTWVMGLGGQYKILNKKSHPNNESDQVALFTLTHEAMASWRLYHPAYLLVGPKLFYMFPSRLAKLPMQKDPNFETEIGAALSVMVAYTFIDKSLFTVRLDRWRGTKTTRFQGIEASFGFAYALK